MKKIFILSLAVILTLKVTFSQSTLILRVFDELSLKPVPYAGVLIENMDTSYSKLSDSNGIVIFNNLLEEDYYYLTIKHINYRDYYDEVYIDDMSIEKEVYISDASSKKYIDDVAAVDKFDMGVFRLSVSPAVNNFKFSYPMSFYTFENRFKLNKFMQFGMKTSLLEFSWLRIDNDFDISPIANIKERYFSFSASFFIYHRFILSRTNDVGYRGLFLDYGVGYRIPYYSAYSIFTSKNTRITEKGIYNLNDFELMARIGYSNFAILATYRITDIAKLNYIEPPKFNIGIELLLNVSY